MDRATPANDAEQAMARITAALGRIEAAADTISNKPSPHTGDSGSNAKVMSLVNKHEAMREEVASTMRELDTVISKLEI